MDYVDVIWQHGNLEDPIRLVSELDDSRYEVRKLEFYLNGQVGFATETESHLDARLGELPVPPLAEINADPQFRGERISSHEFEMLWQASVQRNA